MKKHLVSGIAVLTFVALSFAFAAAFRGLRELNRLESRNDCERIVSVLFASLRDYDDFGSVIEETPTLRGKVVGIGVYEKGGTQLYAWGDAPPVVLSTAFNGAAVKNDMARIYSENAANDSFVLLLHPSRNEPRPPPPPPEGAGATESRREHPFMFETLRDAAVIYLEIRQPEFWRQNRLQKILFPTAEIILAALVLFVRSLVIRNGEYRERIEQEKNLVILGTAASTLAHEIKNPLLAIRLQTSILAKLLHGEGRQELEIIDSEVDRLSSLSNHVGDYLRDPGGRPAVINPVEIACEVGERLCGRNIVRSPPRGVRVRVDPERLRSILENLVRNAIESGGNESEIEIGVGIESGNVQIDVLDRGTGVSESDWDRFFDPFFTTKSKGSGIGLAICRRFAEAAGGSVNLYNRTDGGALARLVLPEVKFDYAIEGGACES